DLVGAGVALAADLQEFFKLREGTGRFCTVETSRLDSASCFVAHVAGRVQLVDSFTEDGEPTTQRLLPAFTLLFVYYPQDGSILLTSSLQSQGRILELFQRFGRTVLGLELVSVGKHEFYLYYIIFSGS